jgi:hypothetical protein
LSPPNPTSIPMPSQYGAKISLLFDVSDDMVNKILVFIPVKDKRVFSDHFPISGKSVRFSNSKLVVNPIAMLNQRCFVD